MNKTDIILVLMMVIVHLKTIYIYIYSCFEISEQVIIVHKLLLLCIYIYTCMCVFAKFVYMIMNVVNTMMEKYQTPCSKRNWMDNVVFLISEAYCMTGSIEGNKQMNETKGLWENTSNGKKQTKSSVLKR